MVLERHRTKYSLVDDLPPTWEPLMNWLECVERRSALAGEDVRFSLSQVEWDFNCDGIFTINDLWEGLKWLVHIPVSTPVGN